ncbi:Cytochrome c biogenesis factor [marine gamma proteobacterium HTCC2143]|uniref:Cytochrome c biogenesis factor n=1 Tax=marine gamma proteobacterium HTCC2143 TaxID=247633 RepID=A0YC58_9GAMM|nr:Cytochrome c biogenesis factor [marine gamma proteobacterium HTCC2143]
MVETLLIPLMLIVLAVFFLLSPVMMNRSLQRSSRSGVNIEFFKSRLSELESDRARGILDDDEFEQLKIELERRLLDEADSGHTAPSAHVKTSFKTAIMLALLIPIVAVVVYQQTGAKADWDIAQTLKNMRLKTADGEAAETDVKQLIRQVEERLEQRPDNGSYLMLLANQQMGLRNYPAAAAAYQRLRTIYPDDASVLAQYAQAMYLSSDRTLTTKVTDMAELALRQDPQQPTVLSMLGMAHFEQGDYQRAIDYWQRLLPSLGPVSPNRKIIMAGIEQAKSRLGSSDTTSIDRPDVIKNASIQLSVSIDEGIIASSDSVVFVFARSASGPRMPLAVAKLTVADLPVILTLDDSMAMAPGLNLSSQKEIEVVARIAKNGIANPGPGDIEGRVGPIKLEEVDGVVAIAINKTL